MQTNADGRVRFSGDFGNFLAMQIWRGLLTLVTLGIHRFWWRTAERRFLWEATAIDGDRLEYRGRGLELLIGTLFVVLGLFLPFSLVVGLLPLFVDPESPAGLIGQGSLLLVYALGGLFLWGFGTYRARRYRLSRTAWRSIRSGMVGNGVVFGRLWLVTSLVQGLTLGLATPWAQALRWNALWSDKMLGTVPVAADAQWQPLFRPFLYGWLGVVALPALLIGGAVASGVADLPAGASVSGEEALLLFLPFLLVLVAGAVVPLLFLNYRARFLSAALAATSVGPVRLGFDARLGDWLRFHLVNAALILFTFGLGLLAMPFRRWGFWMRHVELHGELDPAEVRQSQLQAPGHGEGLADAFDIGGI